MTSSLTITVQDQVFRLEPYQQPCQLPKYRWYCLCTEILATGEEVPWDDPVAGGCSSPLEALTEAAGNLVEAVLDMQGAAL